MFVFVTSVVWMTNNFDNLTSFLHRSFGFISIRFFCP